MSRRSPLILPGLVRYDEVAADEIDHVIRFTALRAALVPAID
jgi:hypothetical protein